MKIKKLSELKGKSATIFVRYGFKKKTGETQSYQGTIIDSDDLGILFERLLENEQNVTEIVFFPWHNIDAIRVKNNP